MEQTTDYKLLHEKAEQELARLAQEIKELNRKIVTLMTSSKDTRIPAMTKAIDEIGEEYEDLRAAAVKAVKAGEEAWDACHDKAKEEQKND